MIEVTITCKECGSGINVHPNTEASEVICQICQTPAKVKFTKELESGVVKDCPVCEKKRLLQTKRFQ